jgi:hypothetical protein
MTRLRVAALVALTSFIALASAGGAGAAPSDPFQWKYSFDGSQVPGGLEFPTYMAVNEATGNLLVYDRGRVVQMDDEGHPVNFSGTGSPVIEPGGGSVMMVDNSGTATQGNIYILDVSGCCGTAGERFWSYGPDGKPLGTNPHEEIGTTIMGFQTGVVAPDGQLWLLGIEYSSQTRQMVPVSPTGPATGPLVPFSTVEEAGVNPSVIDDLGNLYMPGPGGSFRKYDFNGSGGIADLGETGLPVADGPPVIDPSTRDLYVRQGKKALGVHYTDPLVKSTPFLAIDGVTYGAGAMAFDPTGQTLYVAEGTKISVFHREPVAAPRDLGQLGVDGIRSTRAQIHGQLTANGAPSTFHLEYGTDTNYGSSTPEKAVPYGYFPVKVEDSIEGLAPGTTYHVRMVATNSAGSTKGPDRVFTTYGVLTIGGDSCPNALARKQTSAQRLPDCRAFELVSAADTGGYDVESYLAPGQTPYPGFPAATDRVLYATHSGAVPGPWNATNKGPDPYLATRGADGWTTQYEGLPADLATGTPPFSSVLGEADPGLTRFAFAGSGLCSPCFAGGLETGIPVRMPNGELVQGMAGSQDPGVVSAKPEGKVAKYFSGDGRHLVFASKYAFEPGANTGGDLTVYDRNLDAGTTQIVSTGPSGTTLTGAGIGELDVSGDGSRIVVGKRVAVDTEGNEYVHPYMHLGSSPNSVDLAPLATSGVLFAGMTADGSKVFFTTVDKLLPANDTDSSADLYEAAVDSTGTLHLALLTPAPPGPIACNPVANSDRTHWNATGAGANCDAVAVAGGGGVASATGAVYFLSPEQLDGPAGTLNQPNLYFAGPGEAPRFVATLDPDDPLVLDSVADAETRRAGDFQTTANGNYAAFPSGLPLTGVHTLGALQVFSYGAGSGQLDCASCDTTGTSDDSLAEDTTLAPDGLSILEDGRVFFTSRLELVLNDANRRKDVYEFVNGEQKLITAGTGPFDAALLGVSADGTDVYFFTHEALAPLEDGNGSLMRIYDAREGGGFFKLPAPTPCQASDECHGPGTVAPVPPDIRSAGRTTQGNVLTCKKSQVKRAGKCVKKPKKHKNRNGKARQGKGKRHA